MTAAVPELRDRLLEERIRREWPETVGQDAARRTRPKRLVNGCLEVVVDNSPWLQELTLRSAEVTRRLAGRVAGVREVRFVLGALPARPPAPTPAAERPTRELAEAEVRAIDDAVAGITEPAARAVARRLLTKAWAAPARSPEP